MYDMRALDMIGEVIRAKQVQTLTLDGVDRT